MALDPSKYLIIGGGLAADAAVRGIRELDPDGSIRVVSDDSDPPYDRPALSKALWSGSKIEQIWRRTELAGAELCLATRIVVLDPVGKVAVDAHGRRYGYERLLLATGGSPRQLEQADPSVIYFRKLADFRRTWRSASEGAEFAVIGGSLLGSEMAAALATHRRHVSLIFPEDSIGARLYPRPLANFLNVYFRKNGVDVRFGERVDRIDRLGHKLVVRTNGGDGIAADAVVVGIGIEPNVELARGAGLSVRSGIMVDELLRTSHPDIYAAGDVADFPCFGLGRRLRYEHQDNAEAMGRIAGRNMAGAPEPYRHLPCFHSRLFELSYQAVGEINSDMETAEDWIQKFRKGVVYYLRQKRVRGVLLWNQSGLLDAAKALITSGHKQTPDSLRGLLRDAG